MDKIYKNASPVVTWLEVSIDVRKEKAATRCSQVVDARRKRIEEGYETWYATDEADAKAINILQYIHGMDDKSPPHFFSLEDTATEDFYGIDATGSYRLLAVMKLLKKPWFHRRWILQEISFSQHVQVLCGEAVVQRISFERMLEILKNYEGAISSKLRLTGSSVGHYYSSKPNVYDTRDASAIYQLVANPGLKFTMEQLLYRFHTFKISDPRDAVYSLIRMADLQIPGLPNLKADYEVDTRTAYVGLVKHVIAKSRKLNILSRPWAFPGCSAATKLPSWITVAYFGGDRYSSGGLWRIMDQPVPFANSPFTSKFDCNAGFGTHAEAELVFDNRPLLKVAGFELDMIENTISADCSLVKVVELLYEECK